MFKNDKFSSTPKPVKILFFAMVFIGFASLASFVVMLLWNAILPNVTGVKTVNFWQAAGLLLLSKILFGGFGGGKRGSWKNTKRSHRKNKWMNMSQEERQAAREKWKEYCKQKGFDKKGE